MESNQALQDRPIGVFDSGVGGLTVLRALLAELPAETFVYFGDTARVPYGAKSPDTVTAYSRQIARFLLNQQVKLLVVACNTASSCAVPSLRELSPVPVVEVIGPGVRYALERTRHEAVGVIGTESTIKNGIYRRLLLQSRPNLSVIDQPCPLFVPLAEEAWCQSGDPIAESIAARYLNIFKDARGKPLIDALILGCTHYPLLDGVIGHVLGPDVLRIDSAGACAAEVRDRLDSHRLAAARPPADSPAGRARFYVSDLSDRFVRIAERFLGHGLGHVEKVAPWELPDVDGPAAS